MSSEDEPILIAALPPHLANSFAARLVAEGVELELKPADVGRGWEVQIWVHPSQLAQARAVETAYIRASVPDLPEDFDPHATSPSDGCPACGTPVAEGASECGECGLGLPS